MTSTAPNRADLAAYLDLIFGYIEGEGFAIALRGVGEKNTDKEGAPPDVVILAADADMMTDRIFGHVQRWGQHNFASFIVPGAVDALALSDKHATEDRMRLLTTTLVDIDKGDTIAKLAHAQKHLGQPTMTVHSGGTTETGHPKLHAYWRLSEPSDHIQAIAAARKTLALKLGGDPSFGRSTQVIRLPGSVYNKGGAARLCMVEDITGYEYELADLLQAIEDMPVADGVTIDDAKLLPMVTPAAYSMGSGLNFSGFKASGADKNDKPDMKVSLLEPIREGGDDDRNRWGEFNRVAGLHVHQVRTGIITIEEAKQHTHTWMQEKMQPPWPPVRFETEWAAMVALDVRHKGPIATVLAPLPLNITPSQAASSALNPNDKQHPPDPLLSDWHASKWTIGERPNRKFLVDGLVMAGKSHLLAAEGGAGKTFLLLDLALKLATHNHDREDHWCGMPIREDAGGCVVMFTTEDDRDELHIRLSEIDLENRRAQAEDRLIIIPTINIGGAFPLVERGTGSLTRIGLKWGAWLDQLREVAALQPIKLVIIDTLNTTLHGEENNATVINEYVQAASAIVCGELGAALIVTHHVRKPGEKTKIYTPEEMKNSIRGSTALIGAFRVALGIWHAPDYKERLAAIGEEAKRGRLYNFAVVKANNPEMCFDTRTMLRERSGLLRDITDSERSLAAATTGQAEAWMVKAVEYAAEQGHPFTIKAAKTDRRHQLPPMVSRMVVRDIENIAKTLIEAGRIKRCNPTDTATTYNYLDIPDGPLAKGVGLDGMAYRRMAGADFDPPAWERLWAYHPVEQRIVKRGDETSRMVGGAKNTPASEPQKRPGWNPNLDPDLRVQGREHDPL